MTHARINRGQSRTSDVWIEWSADVSSDELERGIAIWCVHWEYLSLDLLLLLLELVVGASFRSDEMRLCMSSSDAQSADFILWRGLDGVVDGRRKLFLDRNVVKELTDAAQVSMMRRWQCILVFDGGVMVRWGTSNQQCVGCWLMVRSFAYLTFISFKRYP